MDLESARLWLTQPGSGAAARRRLHELRSSIKRLKLQPCLYPSGELEGTRELSVAGGYRVVYRLDTNDNATAGNVTVLRVFGPGQSRTTL